jgi:DNA-binding NarL/FixJ family response regulator
MRIVLDGMPRMLRTMVEDILSTDDQCEIVAETSEEKDLLDQLAITPADVIILSITDAATGPERFAKLLAQHPQTRIIAITAGGSRAFLFDLRPHVTQINELSPVALLTAVKQPAAGVAQPM